MTMAMSNNSEIIAEMFLPSISERNSKFKAHFLDFSSFFPQIQTHTFIIFYLIPQLSMSWAQRSFLFSGVTFVNSIYL